VSHDSELPPVCVLAGGLGTRLGAAAAERPKALAPVAGEPFIFHQLRLLHRQGARRVVMCVSHLADQIEAAVGDGSQLGVDVTYSHDGPARVGTAGAVRQALDQLGDTFLVTYGDTYLPSDHRAAYATFRRSGLPALMCVLRNQGRWDTSNALLEDGLVRYDKHAPTSEMEWIDYGLSVLTREALGRAPAEADLADVLGWLSAHDLLAGHEVTERFYEIGTPEALALTDAYLTASEAHG
jgi:NDP-sugar pyrophosphorylase family protein